MDRLDVSASLMLVLFSSEDNRDDATGILESDLQDFDLFDDWQSLHRQPDSLVAKKSYRSGMFRPELSYTN